MGYTMSYLQRLEDFFADYTHQQYKKGQTIIYAGEEPAGVYYLKEGRIRQYTISPETGAILTLHIYHERSFFPLVWAIAGKRNRHFFDSLTPVTLYRAPRAEVLQFLKKEPEIVYHLMARLLSGLDGMLIRVEMLALTDVYGRVISELLYLMKHYGQKDPDAGIVIGKFTHQEISEFVGSARETVSIAMKQLEDKGLIKHKGREICIPDPEKLVRELNMSHH